MYGGFWHIPLKMLNEKYEKMKYSIAVNILGLVNDLIGISETGVNAHIMNGILNIKAAEKELHFGTSKCKMMIIWK